MTLLDDDDVPTDGYYTIGFHRLFGDADGSGIVDNDDLATMASVWLEAQQETGLDGDDDGIVGLLDFVDFGDNWLTEYQVQGLY